MHLTFNKFVFTNIIHFCAKKESKRKLKKQNIKQLPEKISSILTGMCQCTFSLTIFIQVVYYDPVIMNKSVYIYVSFSRSTSLFL